MKSILLSFTFFVALLLSNTTNAQDAVFAGPTFRLENTAIGLNIGVKKDFGDFGAIGQLNYYPYRIETDNSVTERYLTYTDFSLAALYKFKLEKEIIIYPILGISFNTRLSKSRIKSIFEPEREGDFSKGKRQNSVGATVGVGAMKQLGQFNLIADFRYEASDYSSFKLFVGLAYVFGNKSAN